MLDRTSSFAGSASVGGNDAGTVAEDAGVGADGVAVGEPDGGTGGSDGAAAMHCSALPFGCVCSPTEPSQVGACNIGSVIKMPGQRSVCCDSPYNCICVAYECVRISASNCSCQLAAASLAGTRVDECSAPAGSGPIKCCRGYGQCVCSSLDCLPIETPVPSCNIQDLLVCDVGGDSVSRCEDKGGG
jgi:hypothetical protein